MDMFESEILSFEPSLLPLIKGKYACCLRQQDFDTYTWSAITDWEFNWNLNYRIILGTFGELNWFQLINYLRLFGDREFILLDDMIEKEKKEEKNIFLYKDIFSSLVRL